MKSDKWKAIVIKDARLRKVRKNLRELLKLAIKSDIDRLNKLRHLYMDKDRLTPSQWKRKVSFSRAVNDLLHLESRSMLKCSEGSWCMSRERNPNISDLDKDMVWNPLLKEWICIDCYNHYYGTEAQKGELKRHLEKEAALWEEVTKDLPKNMSEHENSEVVKTLKRYGINPFKKTQ